MLKTYNYKVNQRSRFEWMPEGFDVLQCNERGHTAFMIKTPADSGHPAIHVLNVGEAKAALIEIAEAEANLAETELAPRS